MKTILFFQRKKLPKGDEQKEGEKKRRRYFFQRKKLKVPKGTVVVISSFVFFSVLFPFFLPKVIPSAFARVSSFGFFLPEEENKRKKRYCQRQYFGFFLFYSPKGGNCFFFLPLEETEANEPEAIPLWGKVALFLPLVFFF